jgi:salicylate hydroxylase
VRSTVSGAAKVAATQWQSGIAADPATTYRSLRRMLLRSLLDQRPESRLMSSNELQVAVGGGGIGGLAAALSLHARGVNVTVYEQAQELGEIGAGVLMTPNGVRHLERLGVGDALAEKGGPVSDGSTYYRMDGTKVAPILTTDSSGWNGMYGMHRADLLAILADALPSGVVQTGHRCVGFEQDVDSARLTFENGVTAEADVVIAADGIHSSLQPYVTEPSPPVHSRSVAYRGLVSMDELPSWPRGVSQLWMGEGKHFLTYPVRSGELLCYVGFLPSDEHAVESWSAPGDRDALAEAFRGWDSPVEELLTKVESTFWWGLYDREPLSNWTSGRLALLGDAAHPMLPHLGQGANQAIEDGVALAIVLAEADRAEVAEALDSYEAIRRPRTTEVQLAARDNGRRYDSQYDDLDQRDAEIADSGTFRRWLYDYDVAAETEVTSDGVVASASKR